MVIYIDRYIQNGFIQKLLDILGGPFIEIGDDSGGNGDDGGNGNGNGDNTITIHGEFIDADSPITSNPHITQEIPMDLGNVILKLESVDIDIDFSCMNRATPQYISTKFRIMKGMSRITDIWMKVGDGTSIDTSGFDNIGIVVGKSRFSCGEDVIEARTDIRDIKFKLSY